ncbi:MULTISPECIES: hypothetical protein [Thiomicrorhabdus]|uniref:Lipoprotein n=1 Tax=Thiomicrorhabdus heinhorstiae TaxID=2748010 RepID=A0ABS0BUP4_9GAMM|nr:MULTISPECIES: hypothetical protein [Thiomicrorhabdus]MBF6057553.1 hypothetical protein [Thiomicrorhabdus heinhorstiae]
MTNSYVLRNIVFGVLALLVMFVSGCSKEPIKLTSASIVTDLDKGSGNFDRVLKICFDKPLKSDYYHKIVIVTNDNFKFSGEGVLRPLASAPDSLCHLRNIYLYINKSSPVDARQLIKDFIVPGNVKQLLVQVYNQEPEGKELPISERVFNDL